MSRREFNVFLSSATWRMGATRSVMPSSPSHDRCSEPSNFNPAPPQKNSKIIPAGFKSVQEAGYAPTHNR
jgi:hypothetical protein